MMQYTEITQASQVLDTLTQCSCLSKCKQMINQSTKSWEKMKKVPSHFRCLFHCFPAFPDHYVGTDLL